MFIVDHMVLGRDVTCLEVENPAHSSRMLGGDTKIDTTPRPGGEFWDPFPILKPGVKDVTRAAPDPGTAQSIIREELGPSEEFNRGQAVPLRWHVVVQKNSLLHCRGPVLEIEGSWPMQELMEKHGTSKVGNGLDSSLCNCILVVGTNSAEVQGNGMAWIRLEMVLEFG